MGQRGFDCETMPKPLKGICVYALFKAFFPGIVERFAIKVRINRDGTGLENQGLGGFGP